jgi:hypothetical protein
MSTKNFSLEKIERLNENAPLKAKAYLEKYFVPLSNGNHAMLIDGRYVIKETKEITATYFDRMPPNLKKYYFKEFKGLRSVVYKLNKPALYDDKLNMCPAMKHVYKPYKTFSDKAKKGVELIKKYIKDVYTNNCDKSAEFQIKWYANMIKGNKNNSCLYYKSPQGTGKSSFQEFIRIYVVGEDLSLETGSAPLTSQFNSILGGKLYVCYEELENFGPSQWAGISSKLKRYITSSTILLEEKNKNSYKADNLNNSVINSNCDAVKEDDGRRFFIADVSTRFIGNTEYFNIFYDTVMNDEVGHAFYCYLMEVDTENFNPQIFPVTNNKLDSIAKRLDSVYQFLKDEFVLTGLKMNVVVADIFKMYQEYCFDNSLRAYGKIDFNKKMQEINLNYSKGTGGKVNVYKYQHDVLLEIATRLKWIHKLDVFEQNVQSKVKPEKVKKVEEEDEDDDEEEEVKPVVQILDQVVKVEEKKVTVSKKPNQLKITECNFDSESSDEEEIKVPEKIEAVVLKPPTAKKAAPKKTKQFGSEFTVVTKEVSLDNFNLDINAESSEEEEAEDDIECSDDEDYNALIKV